MSRNGWGAGQAQAQLEGRISAAGFAFRDILYGFLTRDFLPGWRLTPRGVLDVKTGEIVASPVSAL